MLINFKSSNFDCLRDFIDKKRMNVNILKLIASFFVIFIHSRWLINNDSFSIVIDSIFRPGVIIFLLCTSFNSFFKKKNNWKSWFNVLISLYIFNFIYELRYIIEINSFNYLSIFFPMLFGSSYFWYVKIYLLFYPLIPFLNKMISEKKEARLFILFFIFFITLNTILNNFTEYKYIYIYI